VITWPSRTRNAPYTHTFSGPLQESMEALMRCPSADQPGAGGKVRGTTGPSSSVQMVVDPLGGRVEWVTTVVLLGRSLCRYSLPSSESDASVCPPARTCAGSGCMVMRSPSNTRKLHWLSTPFAINQIKSTSKRCQRPDDLKHPTAHCKDGCGNWMRPCGTEPSGSPTTHPRCETAKKANAAAPTTAGRPPVAQE
jgi:hypothetical protein